MPKKGVIQEILSKAQFADNPSRYKVGYRDFETIKEISLPEFLVESNNFEIIPVSRIYWIKKGDVMLFKKIQK